MDNKIWGKLLNFIKEISGSLLTYSAAIIFAAVCGLVLEEYQVSTPIIGVVSIIGPLTISLFLTNPPATLYARLIANRKEIVTSSFFVLAAPSVISISYWGIGDFWELLSHHWVLGYRVFLTGAIVGILIKVIISRNYLLSLSPHSFNFPKVLLIPVLTLSVLLIPLPPIPKIFCAIYSIGIGSGIFAHFWGRYFLHRRYHRAQRLINLVRRFRGESQNTRLTDDEKSACRHYAYGKFKKLEKDLEDAKPLTTTLAIIKVCMLRKQGNYKHALKVIGDLKLEKDEEHLRSKLYCLRALCLGDQEEKDEEMKGALESGLNASNNECLLSNLTYGLRLAETVPFRTREWDQDREDPFSHIPMTERAETAYGYVDLAFELNNKQDASLEGPPSLERLVQEIVGVSVPVTWSYLIDSYAYASMKRGGMKISKTLLRSCIASDPNFSSAYLHLAEWYMRQVANYHVVDTARKEALKIAEIALYVAIYLEDKKNSRIRRRAGLLLEDIEPLKNPGPRSTDERGSALR